MAVIVITGTDTGVGKTVVTAAVAALARGRVAVLKPAQTGVAVDEPGDLAEITRLAGPLTTRELARYPDPLAPDTAARLAGRPPVTVAATVAAVRDLAADHDLVLVEGAGGLLVRFDPDGGTIADVARELAAPVLLVVAPGLGTLNHTALTVEAVRRRGVELLGLVIGSWPDQPDLACRQNLHDLPSVSGAALLGTLPEGATARSRSAFRELAATSLVPLLGGHPGRAMWQATPIRTLGRTAGCGEVMSMTRTSRPRRTLQEEPL